MVENKPSWLTQGALTYNGVFLAMMAATWAAGLFFGFEVDEAMKVLEPLAYPGVMLAGGALGRKSFDHAQNIKARIETGTQIVGGIPVERGT